MPIGRKISRFSLTFLYTGAGRVYASKKVIYNETDNADVKRVELGTGRRKSSKEERTR